MLDLCFVNIHRWQNMCICSSCAYQLLISYFFFDGCNILILLKSEDVIISTEFSNHKLKNCKSTKDPFQTHDATAYQVMLEVIPLLCTAWVYPTGGSGKSIGSVGLWVTWCDGRYPCPWQWRWNYLIFKLPSTQTTLWYYEEQLLELKTELG